MVPLTNKECEACLEYDDCTFYDGQWLCGVCVEYFIEENEIDDMHREEEAKYNESEG